MCIITPSLIVYADERNQAMSLASSTSEPLDGATNSSAATKDGSQPHAAVANSDLKKISIDLLNNFSEMGDMVCKTYKRETRHRLV